MAEPPRRQPLLPTFLLARFADAQGRVMAERRDRSRRRLLPVEQAAAEVGYYAAAARGRGPELGRLLVTAERRAAEVLAALPTGGFPPPAEGRRALALFLAFQLLAGHGHREARARAAALLGSAVEVALAQAGAEAGGAEGASSAAPPEPAPPDVVVVSPLGERAGLDLGSLPELARLLAARTWQLVRFPGRLLLTSDTPVALWARPGAGPSPLGLGAAEEVRVPLDPGHALVVARRAAAGEVVRDLEERHARALNRTVAEAAREWIFYHPESDPLEGVELAPP